MRGITDPETYLRLNCERTLLDGDSTQGILDGFEGAVISRVLTAAGTLSEHVGSKVLDEYQLARVLRDGRKGRMFMRQRALAQGPRQRLSAQRVVVGERLLTHGKDRWILERLLFADDACHLQLAGADPAGPPRPMRRHMNAVPAAPGGARAQPHPTTIALVDDRGSSVTARVGHASWGGGSWEASYTSDKPLSPDTRWIEVDGNRLELPERHATPPVRVDQIEPLDPLRAALYAEILSTDRRRAGADTVDIACRALVSTGASDDDDPMLTELRAIADAVTNAMPAPGLPEPWSSLVARYRIDDGRSGTVPVGAVFDDIEGYSVRIDALISEPTSFSLALAVSPGTPLLTHFPGGIDQQRFPIAWWAEDDRGNVYVASPDRAGGSDVVAEGVVTSLSSLDPKATELTLFPTGKHSRGVVTVHLSALEEA